MKKKPEVVPQSCASVAGGACAGVRTLHLHWSRHCCCICIPSTLEGEFTVNKPLISQSFKTKSVLTVSVVFLGDTEAGEQYLHAAGQWCAWEWHGHS